MGVIAFLGLELGAGAGRADQLATLAGFQLHIVDDGTQGDIPEGQAIAHLDIGCRSRIDHSTYLELIGSQDISFLAVGIVEQGNVGGTVGIVFDGSYLGGNAIFGPAKIDDSVLALMTTTTVTNGQ